MSVSPANTIFYGPVINPESLSSFQALPRCLLAIDATGEIVWIEKDVSEVALKDVLARHGSDKIIPHTLKHGEFLLPGFVDTHTHAPQFPNLSGQQYELLDWLKKVTFPMEIRFENEEFARQAYDMVVKRVIDCGTTTCCYYGTLHLEATKILAKTVNERGQRAFVGKCNMDRNNLVPGYKEQSASASLKATHALITFIRDLPEPRLVEPVLTPRFALSCTNELMFGLGDMARKDSTLRIQTHISENRNEIDQTLKCFPGETYAQVYSNRGLLGPRTILAHAVHLEESEIYLVKAKNAGVSHCPTSNFNLRSGICPVGKLLDHGIKVGLGTDVSGGFSPSILTVIQHASIASKVLSMQACAASSTTSKHEGRQLPLETLLHLATLGGAQVCNLEGRIGSFAQGKAFDALLVSVRGDAGNPGLWGADLDEELDVKYDESKRLGVWLERFFFTGDYRNIKRVYVQGRLIGGTEVPIEDR